jgi:hypothetical protein
MAEKGTITREVFAAQAAAAGLDVSEAHLNVLYGYVQGVLPLLQGLDDLDLAGLGPEMPDLVAAAKEGKRS